MSDKPDKDQKTEKPTPKRKKDARKDGQIAKSPEVSAWVLLIATTYLIPTTMGSVYESMHEVFRGFGDIAVKPDARSASELMGKGLASSLTAVMPLLGFAALLGIVVTLGQVGFVFTGKALKPKMERLSPMKGFKKLFSVKSLWETVKSVAKLAAVAAVAIPAVMTVSQDMVAGPKYEMTTVLSYVGAATISLVRSVGFVALIIAAADYLYQRRSMAKQLMMTKTEMKMEMKNSEGDPMVKAKMRALQRAMSQNSMLASIPEANVVIMNPTHFAVALRYRAGEGAPRVVARGQDRIALKIRERAQEHKVPVVEAAPLARALYKACDIEQEIPVKLFGAVAKVLAFVHRLSGRTSLTGVFVLPDIQVDADADS